MATSRVDINGWLEKSSRLRAAMPEIISDLIDYGMDTLQEATIKNVSGPAYGTKGGRQIRGLLTNAGKLPVPVVFGSLRRSIQKRKINPTLGAVYSDDDICPHNKWVYYGTRKMRPRAYLKLAVQERRPAIENRGRYMVISEIRKIGRER